MSRGKLFCHCIFCSALLLLASGCDFTQYLAHYATTAEWASKISVQNPYHVAIKTVFSVIDENGASVAQKEIWIPANGHYASPVQSIFAEAIPTQGAIKVVSSEPSVVRKVNGIAMFTYGTGQALGGLQTFSKPAKTLYFPWFENTSAKRTGIAILNTESFPIQAFLRATSASGEIRQSGNISLGPGKKILGYAEDFFGPDKDQSPADDEAGPGPDAHRPLTVPEEATLSAFGSGKMAGFLIVHDNSVQEMEAVNGVPGETAGLTLAIPPGQGPAMPFSYTPTFSEFTRDGNFLIIRFGSSIVAFDRYNEEIARTTSVPAGNAMALSPTGRTIYYASNEADNVYAAGTPLPNVLFFPRVIGHFQYAKCLAASRDGKYLGAVSSETYTVWDLTNGNAVVATGTNGDENYYRCIFSDDSAQFVFTSMKSNRLYHFDLATATLHYTDLPNRAVAVVQSPYSRKYYVSSEDQVIPVDGTTFNDLTPIPVNGDPYYLFFSPDGNLLYIPCAGSTKLHVYNEPLAKFEAQDYALDDNPTASALSPEGDTLMYIDFNMFLRAVY